MNLGSETTGTHPACTYTMVYYGILGYTMVYCGILWVYYGILWYTMGILCYTMLYYRYIGLVQYNVIPEAVFRTEEDFSFTICTSHHYLVQFGMPQATNDALKKMTHHSGHSNRY